MNRSQWVMAFATVIIVATALWFAAVLHLPWWSDVILVVSSVIFGAYSTWDLR